MQQLMGISLFKTSSVMSIFDPLVSNCLGHLQEKMMISHWLKSWVQPQKFTPNALKETEIYYNSDGTAVLENSK